MRAVASKPTPDLDGGREGRDERADPVGFRAIGATLDTVLRDLVRQVVREELPPILRQALAPVARAEPARPAQEEANVYLTAKAAAEIVGVHPTAIRRWVWRGALPGYRAGRLMRVRLDELKAFLGRAPEEPDVDVDDAARQILARQAG